MIQAKGLWDQFTSGNAVQRAAKLKEQEEAEEKARLAEIEKRK